MIIETVREDLLPAITRAATACESRAAVPILEHLLLTSDGSGRLHITGTDLGMAIKARCPVNETELGAVAINAKRLKDAVSAMPDGQPIRIEWADDRATIRCGRIRYSLSTLPAGDFPAVEMAAPEATVTVQSGDLSGLITRAAFAMANKDVRYYLNGALLAIGPGQMRIVSTDGHRLAMGSMHCESTGAAMAKIIPGDTIRAIAALAKGKDRAIRIDLSETQIRLTDDQEGSEMMSKLIEGRYPEWEKVVPTNLEHRVEIPRADLLAMANRVGIMANDKFRGVRLHFETGQLRLTAVNESQDDAEDVLPIGYTGPTIVIGVNLSYLRDALSAVPDEVIPLSFTDANTTMRLDPVAGGVLVVMPMRL